MLRTPEKLHALISDDIAYILPIATFILLTAIASLFPSTYVVVYSIKTFIVAAMLLYLWPRYTKITWRYWWLGVIVGVVGVVQWVGMELVILHFFPHYPRPSVEVFNPVKAIGNPTPRWLFISLRWADAVLVVPFMEERFWRDFLWRSIIAPNDFHLAFIGEFEWQAVIVVTLAFCSVHVQWITAIVWGAMIAVLLVRTRSLGACIVAHAVTNFLLGGYVLWSHNWYFW
ncbi:MAG TPA: CAAX prenyl protease-related protein [Tepidisphaeraceae bacterium]|nr:CAAX prenyl protease-related protein [Tepidisphaeraceae bacterium]